MAKKYIEAGEFWNRLISVSENDWVGFDTIDEVLSEMPAEPSWIPVAERLPQTYGKYFVSVDFDSYLGVGLLWYGQVNGKDAFYDSDSIYGDTEWDEVTAWMPLPTPYKGGDEE